MKNALTFLFLFLLLTSIHSQNKSRLDLKFEDSQDQNAFLKGPSQERLINSNEIISYTLLEGGYFTIGTKSGVSDTKFDDNCQITYGHPYALTSFPVISIDGEIYKLSKLFIGNEPVMEKVGDTLSIKYSNQEFLDFKFSTFPNEESGISIKTEITNNDTALHIIKTGSVIDAALGKWGDGFLFVNDVLQETGIELTNFNIPENFNIWEKKSLQKGINLEVNYEQSELSSISINNWQNLSLDDSLMVDEVDEVFDLAVQLMSEEINLESEQSLVFEISLNLGIPDFNEAFFRWDLPTALEIIEGRPFPQQLKTYIEGISLNSDNYEIQISDESILNSFVSNPNFSVNHIPSFSGEITINAQEVYENIVLSPVIEILKGSEVIDQIERKFFVPASPFSNIGINVQIDSLITDNFPVVQLKFNSTIEETGRYITDLKSQNIFLYEDDIRIPDFTISKDTSGGTASVDIVFVLDVTGSMGDEIASVRNNIIEFTDSLEENGFDYRLGMVTFLDYVENIYPFTDNPIEFKSFVSQQYAHGGGDYTENSLDALNEVTQFEFRDESNRIVIWITDANYHIANDITSLTVNEIVDNYLFLGIKAYCIGNPDEQTNFYDPIVEPTGGEYFNINGNFRDILLEISRQPNNPNYILSYTSNVDLDQGKSGNLEIHYAGLGGSAEFELSTNSKSEILQKETLLKCYPNPFNPVTNIEVTKPINSYGEMNIFNILGEKVKGYRIESGSRNFSINWNARNDWGGKISSGFYIVSINLYDTSGKLINNLSQKLIYLK